MPRYSRSWIVASPQAVQALKNTTYQHTKDAFTNVSFPVACSTHQKTNCFRLSWNGHHNLADQDCCSDFAPEHYPFMSEAVGFPVISSLMVAIKSRYIDGLRNKDLGSMFEDQFTSIQRRYYSKGCLFSAHQVPHHNLLNLPATIDGGYIQPNSAALGCPLYQLKREWFTTTELVVSLPPTGKEGAKVANVIVVFVRQKLLQWHSKNPMEYIAQSKRFNDRRAGIRLSTLMSSHYHLFHEFTLASSNGLIIVLEEEFNDDGLSIQDWAAACVILPSIVDQIDLFIQDNKGESLWKYMGSPKFPIILPSFHISE